MTAPAMTLGTTLHTSASLAASGVANDVLDITTKFEAQITFKVTAGATVAATFGLQVDIFGLYSGTTYPQDNATAARDLHPIFTYTLAGYQASDVAYTPKIYVPTGRYKVRITNLDATNAITVEGIYDTVDSVS